MNEIVIHTHHLERMIQYARKGYPEEVCGILAGKDNTVLEVFQMMNIEYSPVSYFMDSREQFRVMKTIRQKGLKVVAIYHSHPEAEAYPSAEDIRLAFYEDVAYIIISLLSDEPLVRAFTIIDGKVKKITIVSEL